MAYFPTTLTFDSIRTTTTVVASAETEITVRADKAGYIGVVINSTVIDDPMVFHTSPEDAIRIATALLKGAEAINQNS